MEIVNVTIETIGVTKVEVLFLGYANKPDHDEDDTYQLHNAILLDSDNVLLTEDGTPIVYN